MTEPTPDEAPRGLAIVRDPTAVVAVRTSQGGAAHLEAWTAQQRATAVHEAGHAVIARVLGVPVKSVSIKERWGGATLPSDDDDDRNPFRTWADELNRITVMLAGLAVTEVALGERMSGAHGDMRQATMAVLAALDAGMDPHPDTPFITMPYRGEQATLSEWVANGKSKRAEAILREQYRRAFELCERNREAIVAFASLLFEHRRLSDGALESAFVEAGLP